MAGFFQEWQSRSLLEMFAGYFRSLGSRPCDMNPWPEEIEQSIRDLEALPVCHRCFLPLEEPVWFCPDCGASVGPYNNWIPNLAMYTVGEVLRTGVGPNARFTKLTVPGYVATACSANFLIAPFYFLRFFINWIRLDGAEERDSPDTGEENE